jgi:hypothetical protein
MYRFYLGKARERGNAYLITIKGGGHPASRFCTYGKSDVEIERSAISFMPSLPMMAHQKSNNFQ